MPIYRFDSTSRISWLEFDGKPEQATIDLLKSEGWRWSSFRKQWHTNRRFAQVPAGIEFEDGGECDYSSERPDRLKNAAERAEERSEQAYEHSNALVEGIPFGQPILVGHHSQRHHEKTLERSRSAMDKSVEEQKKAEHLEYKAKSSARHQAYKERPDVIARRIKRLKSDIVSIRNSMKYEPYGLWTAREQGDAAKIAEIMTAWEASNQRQEEKIRIIEQEIAENERALQEAGGLVADKLVIEVGDIILGRWQGRCKVEKINKRNGQVMSYTCRPLSDTWCSKRILPLTDVVRLVEKADGTIPGEEAPEPVELIETPEVRPTVAKEQKPEREFKVQAVETVEVYDNRTSLFPTPVTIADQLAQHIPPDARLILEPSAGTGSLAGAVTRLVMERGQNCRIHCCEILPKLRYSLIQRGYKVVGENFLDYKPDFKYQVVVMNPPFANTEWVDHIEHALELLEPGGTLLAIVPAGFAFRTDKRITAFREMVEEYGEWEYLPEDSFVESGTSVRTVMLVVHTPEVQQEPSTLWGTAS